jgi:hypothetical protein
MKKYHFFTTLFLIITVYAAAQTVPAIQWQKSLGGSSDESASLIEQTTDGGYIMTTSTTSIDGDVSGNHGFYDYWIVKFTNIGTIQWQKCLGGSGDDEAVSIHQTTDRGYIVAGTAGSNDGDVSGNHGIGDYWIVKLDGTGSIQWQKSLGGSNDDDVASIEQTSDGGYIIAGSSLPNDGDVTGHHGFVQNYDYWIVKLDPGGTIQWQKSFGGSFDDQASSIHQTSDGGYIIWGISISNDGDVTGHHGNPDGAPDIWIVKINSTGTIQWQKSLGGTGYENGSIEQTSDGGYIVCGSSDSNDGDVTGNHGSNDDWIVKLDSSGLIEWQKSLGGSGDDGASFFEQTSDSGYIVAGSSNSNDGDVTGNHGGQDCWIVKLKSSGVIDWQKSLGGSGDDGASFIEKTSDSGYIVAGSSNSNDGDVSGNHGSTDDWIVKLDSRGTIQWQKCLGGSSGDFASSIKETSDKGYIVAGSSNSNDGDITGNHGGQDCWIVKFAPDALLPVSLLNFYGDVNGNKNVLHWSTASEQNNTGFEVQRSNDGYNFKKVGFVNTMASNGNADTKLSYYYIDNNFSTSINYYRLKQIDRDGKLFYSSIVELRKDNHLKNISVFPNPAKDLLHVKLYSMGNGKRTLLLNDINGKILRRNVIFINNNETTVDINISELNTGTYFLKIISEDGNDNIVEKFTKE